MPKPRPIPVNVLVSEHGRIFAVRAPRAIVSDSGTYAVIEGAGKYANKWMIVHTLQGKAMGEYFGHFDTEQSALEFQSHLDILTPAPLVSDGFVSGCFVRKWNIVCRSKKKPILTKRILLSYFLTTSRGM